MKRVIKIICIALCVFAAFIAIVWYALGCMNFGMGSNTMFIDTLSREKYEGRSWISKNKKFAAETIRQEIENDGRKSAVQYLLVKGEGGEEYVVRAVGDRLVYIYYGDVDFSEDDYNEKYITSVNIDYKKRFWKLYGFILYDVDSDDFSIAEGKKTVFYKG